VATAFSVLRISASRSLDGSRKNGGTITEDGHARHWSVARGVTRISPLATSTQVALRLDGFRDRMRDPNVGEPFLRWAGSKRRLLPRLIPYWTGGYTRYIEPFMGSAALYFALGPRRAVLADSNPDLVQTFEAVRRYPTKVGCALHEFALGAEPYYALRALSPKTLDPVQRAARFIYLNRFCFNGLYRTNASGAFNVPYSPRKTGPLPSIEKLMAVGLILRRASIMCRDFEETLEDARSGDFVYLDPPYAVRNRRVFRQYTPGSFSLRDLPRLITALHAIELRGAKFLITYAYCKEAIDAFGPWHTTRAMTQRNVAGFARHRRRAVEVLASNCAAPWGRC
jgi:DNA adenine methylase